MEMKEMGYSYNMGIYIVKACIVHNFVTHDAISSWLDINENLTVHWFGG